MSTTVQSLAHLFPLETFTLCGVYSAKIIKKSNQTTKQIQLTTAPRVLTLVLKKKKKQKKNNSARLYLVKEQSNGMPDKGRYLKLKRLEQIEFKPLDTSTKSIQLLLRGGNSKILPQKEGNDYMICTISFQLQKPLEIFVPVKARNELVVFLARMSKIYEEQFGNSPKMIGVERTEMNLALETAESGLDSSMEQMDQFVTEEEEDLLTQVLQEYNLDISDPSTVTKELTDRLQEMETHNINEILERNKEWLALVERIRNTKNQLLTMKKSLNLYQNELQNLKLDISQIEQKNNEMDVQSTNHEKLRKELQNLSQQFGYSEKDERVLTTYNFEIESQLTEIKELVSRIENALANDLGYGMDSMVSIIDRRTFLSKKRKDLVDRFIQFLLKQFSTKGLQLMKELQKKTNKDLLDQREIVYELKKYESLMTSVKGADLNGKKYYLGYLNLLAAYSNAMSDPYSSQLKAFFKGSRSLIERNEESKSSNMFFLGIAKGNNSSTISLLNNVEDAPPPTPSTNQSSDDESDVYTFGGDSTTIADGKFTENMRVDHAFTRWLSELCELIYAEENFCCQFFLLNPDPGEVFENKELKKMLEKMFKVLISSKNYITSLLSWIEKNTDLFYILPMLNETEKMISQYESSTLLPSILSEILKELNQSIFTKFKDKQCLSITNFKASPKKLSVVPYFAQFPRFMERIERVLKENDSSKRHHAENAYQNILTIMFTSMEKIGKTDSKHYYHFALKNYAFFSRTVGKCNSYPSNSTQFISPCVNDYVQKSIERFSECLQGYIIQTIKYRFEPFFNFFEGIEECRKTIDISDVKFQSAFTSTKLTDLIKRFNSSYRKDIEDCLKRMDKHIGPKSEKIAAYSVNITEYNLFGEVWIQFRDYFLKRYEDFSILTRKCYTNLKSELNPVLVIRRTFTEIEKENENILKLQIVSQI